LSLIFLAGDVMTGRGIDQILPCPSDPRIEEEVVKDARDYILLAESRNGPIARRSEPSYVWGDALEILEELAPDARVINLETSVTASDDRWEGKDIHYRMHPRNVACLTSARIDVSVLANNHVLDHGHTGLLETVQTLRDAGIRTAGAGRNLDEAFSPAAIDAKDNRFVVVGLGAPNSGIPSDWAATSRRPGVALLRDLSDSTAAAIGDRIASVRGPRDIVVASIHWGTNWGYAVPEQHVRFAHRLIDAGVDIVHGHSSHHPRPIEVYRDRPILYGCGDLINDYEGIEGYEDFRDDLGLMFFAKLEPVTSELVELAMKPMQITRFSLHSPSHSDRKWLAIRLNEINADFGTRVAWSNDGMLRLDWRSHSPSPHTSSRRRAQ
jgi:poly-gamma-glutamate synthesis protein (capsule biosynthesis protein)